MPGELATGLGTGTFWSSRLPNWPISCLEVCVTVRVAGRSSRGSSSPGSSSSPGPSSLSSSLCILVASSEWCCNMTASLTMWFLSLSSSLSLAALSNLGFVLLWESGASASMSSSISRSISCSMVVTVSYLVRSEVRMSNCEDISIITEPPWWVFAFLGQSLHLLWCSSHPLPCIQPQQDPHNLSSVIKRHPVQTLQQTTL